MKKQLRFLLLYIMPFAFAKAQVATLSTPSAGSITTTTATIVGNITTSSQATVTYNLATGSSSNINLAPNLGSQTQSTGTWVMVTNLNNLLPNTTYYFRFRSQNTSGTSFSPIISFTTLKEGPTISNVSAAVTSNAATINYTLNANNDASTSIVKYGLAANALNNQVSGFSATGSTATTGSAAIAGLAENTVYHYEIEATNVKGTNNSTGTFTTSMAPKLIAEYNFNNTYNNTLGTNPFSSNGGTSFTADRHGNANSALNINNTGSQATITELPYGNSPRTITFWAKANALRTDYNMTFSYGQGVQNRANGGSFVAGAVTYLAYNNNLHSSSAANLLATWYFFTYTYDGTTAKIYRNGTLIGSETKAWTTFNNNDIFRLGIGVGNEYWFNGAIDDLKIYNYALNNELINNLYNLNTLPVNLVSFTAKAQNNSTALNWETVSETNNSHFVIKRSLDGVNFGELNTVAAKSTNGAKYQFIDNNPAAGTNYYQLLQVDLDGTTKDLDIKTVSFSLQKTVKIFPNPTADKAEVTFNAGNFTNAKLTDVNGKILQKINISKLQYSISLSMATYPKGLYLLQLQGDKELLTQKIIKR